MQNQQVVEMNCPGCGARVSVGQAECEWCHEPVTITTFNSVYSMPLPKVNKYASSYQKALADNPNSFELNCSIAICYLKLKLYDKALLAFEKAMEDNFDNSETFFYASICLLKGKRPFLAKRESIEKIVEYMNAAMSIEPRGIYYYFLAYVKYDFYELKRFRTTPNYRELLELAHHMGCSLFDINQLFSTLGTDKPNGF